MVLNYEWFSKGKGMNIFKLLMDGTQQKIYVLDKIFLPKIIALPNGEIHIIGGSDDLKITNALPTHLKLKLNLETNQYETINMAPLTTPRASSGCCMSQDKK